MKQAFLVDDIEYVSLNEYPGYAAGSDGFIYSYKRSPMPYRLKSQLDGRKNYYHVQLPKEGKFKSIQVHTLICEAFNGKKKKGQEVSHLD